MNAVNVGLFIVALPILLVLAWFYLALVWAGIQTVGDWLGDARDRLGLRGVAPSSPRPWVEDFYGEHHKDERNKYADVILVHGGTCMEHLCIMPTRRIEGGILASRPRSCVRKPLRLPRSCTPGVQPRRGATPGRDLGRRPRSEHGTLDFKCRVARRSVGRARGVRRGVPERPTLRGSMGDATGSLRRA